MSKEEFAAAFKDLYQGWNCLFQQVKADKPSFSDQQINQIVIQVTKRDLGL